MGRVNVDLLTGRKLAFFNTNTEARSRNQLTPQHENDINRFCPKQLVQLYQASLSQNSCRTSVPVIASQSAVALPRTAGVSPSDACSESQGQLSPFCSLHKKLTKTHLILENNELLGKSVLSTLAFFSLCRELVLKIAQATVNGHHFNPNNFPSHMYHSRKQNKLELN